MNKWIFFFFLFVVFHSSAQERQFTVWNKNEVSVSPSDKLTLKLAQKVHYSPERNSIDLKYGEFLLGYETKAWLEYGLGFRHSKANLQNGSWLDENRPMIYCSLSKEIKKMELSFSNRLEYRFIKNVENHLRHKQSLNFSFPNITDWGMQFYVSEESYLKLNGAGTHLARLYTGVKALDKLHFEMKVYYSLQKAKSLNSWISSDIVGLNLNFTI